MSIQRYLVHLAYIGTPFRGSQRQIKGGTPRQHDPTTIQGMMEMGLQYLNPISDTIVFMASRTDAGVHALNTTCHFDLHRPVESVYEPNQLTYRLNKFMAYKEVPIRILDTKLVPDDFHCRQNAVSRTYLYRLIIGRHDQEKLNSCSHFMPIEEHNRAYFHCDSYFDINSMREAANMFVGFHDFRTFMGKVRDNDRLTRREISSIEIIERSKSEVGVAPSFSWPKIAIRNSGEESHSIVDIYFKGKGFLYKQVRRTAGTLLSAAVGRITLRDIKFMLEIPSKHSWIPKIRSLPGYGLYLCEIEY
ncbi:unnamed protein product [Ceutorhynchus assimilis]|uniref:tRNA pseudouridine synthase n=1 Tax=Ceutorhynchus assimilis TaxID=467358 RepID=A0A9N9M995_9CUCU|nr:unnamed protein product [Ceutorhynchus assimilis]